MRGFDQPSDALFVYLSPESFAPKDHPLRPVRQMVDAALVNLFASALPDVFPHWSTFNTTGTSR